jgi:DNA-binding response OmpR family regulator
LTKQVLIVDDEPNIVLSLEFLMKQAGYGVRTASDGEAALQAVRESPPDLVLLDVNLPRRSGYEVCEALRSNPDWAAVRIVMLTAKGRDIERQKGMALGANDYVTKPFSTREVVHKVRAILGDEPSG